MLAYIKSVKTWGTIAYAEPISYSAPVLSNNNLNGTFAFAPDAPIVRGCEGNWLVFSGFLWIIDRIQPSVESIKVTVKDAYNAFYRSHVFVNTGQQTCGEILQQILVYNYAEQSDMEYAMPYLSVENADTTPAIFPELTDGLVFKAADYIRTVTQRGVRLQLTPTTGGVEVSITSTPTNRKTIIFNDGHSQLEKVEFSADMTTKITVVVNGENAFYYLQADGSISTTPPEQRLPGKWQTFVAKENDDPVAMAAAVFAKNTAAVQIDFYSDIQLSLGDLLRVKTPDGSIFETVVSYKLISSEDSRYHYKAGSLPVTLTEKIRAIDEKTEYASGSAASASVGSGILTIKQGGVEKGAFSANAATDVVINLDAGGGGGTTDHNALYNRDAANQHPMSSITGLSNALAGKQATVSDLATIREGAALGATAVQPSAISDMATKTWVNGRGFGTYTKPSGGIPKTDLASAVQTSLGRADTALQTHQSLAAYRTAEAQNVIDAQKYEKPSGGIPLSDLDSDDIDDVPIEDSDKLVRSGGVYAGMDEVATGLTLAIARKYTKPSGGIPASDLANGVVGSGNLTIKQGGTTKGTFSANATGNATIELDAGGETDLIISAVWVGTLAPGNILSWDYEIVSGDVSNVMNKIKADTTYMPKILLRRIDEYIEGCKDIRILTDCTLVTDESDPTATALEFLVNEITVFNPSVSYRSPPRISSVFLYSDGTFSGTWTGDPYE